MRNDMIKVVAEPARGGSSYRIAKGEKGRLQREGIDSVQREGLGRRWQRDDRRPMRDHLQALRRFLRKQVGRRWDEVYSEICSNAPKGSFLGQHVRELVSYEVSADVTVVGDTIYGARGWPVTNGDLYACPETNILTVKDNGQPRRRYRWRPRSDFEMLAAGANQRYVKLDDVWFLVSFEPIPGLEVTQRPFDVVLKVPVFALGERSHASEHRVMRTWGGNIYAAAKRQVDSRTARRIAAALADGKTVLVDGNSQAGGKAERSCFRRRA